MNGVNDSLYQAWHRSLGHAEYRCSITMRAPGYGTDEDAAEAFLDGFLEAHPETGPVISQDREADTITATFSLSATNQSHAHDLAVEFWVEGGVASGLAPGEVLRASLDLVEDDVDATQSAELQPA